MGGLKYMDLCYILAIEHRRAANAQIHEVGTSIDWLQSLKQFFINVPYHILVASLTLMALF